MAVSDYLFEIIVGTYEEYVLGYKLVLGSGEDSHLVQSFATHSHRGSVRTLATKGKLLVSGSADETINIYDMVQRKESGMLMEHSGTITCLSFTPDGSHLVAASEDGSIKFFRVGSWQVEKDFSTAHKGTAVNYLSIHPSGKMALSVGRDHTLRTWNLVKGRPAYTTNLASRCKNLELVEWSPGGNYYAVSMVTRLEIFSVETAGVAHTVNFDDKICSLAFTRNNEGKEDILVGEANGKVTCCSVEEGKKFWSIEIGERIKSIQTLSEYLVLGTSGGQISVYTFVDRNTEPKFVTSTDTGCRITCIAVYNHLSQMQCKKQETTLKDSKKPEKLKKRKSDFKIEDSKSKNVCRRNSNSNVKCTIKDQKWLVEDSKLSN